METNRTERTGSISSALHAEGPREESLSSSEPASVMPPSKTAQMVASGDLGAMIAAMLLESGAKSREVAKTSKDSALAAEDAAMNRKLQKMEEAADQKLYAGIAGASATFLSGAMSFVGGVGTAKEGRGSLVGNTAPGGGKMLEAGGNLAAAVFTHASAEAEREVVAADRAITQAQRGISSASETDKDAKELLGRALDHYKAFLQSTDEARKAALFRA